MIIVQHYTYYLPQLSEEEKQHLERFFTHEGESRRLEYLNSRRKSKKTYEYEVKWYGVRDSKNTWITREQCVFTSYFYPSCCPPMPNLYYVPCVPCS